ncbi:hypothetical protein AA0498_1825 [Acidomonas methanolica]|uniref:Uncharacterized protein n=1 Tax=Acidomonas methanolica NBRC 104435 TaxID=1231351 RepID=A0A023D6R3_ACIMT|nr:hypothetical protein Amme_083_013 [Acidomonas methanolica NBRC 104435]GBQ52891.1 hypothetical protein AA0498_1825 [Acidomonas methanolica]GEL00187.1 hypothetical protein AME01nite_26850 [Acidomonas methanolica NBRC 104435]
MGETACCRVSVLAERWDCSPAKIRRMIDAGELPVLRLGTMIRIPWAAVREIETNAACQQPINRVCAESQDERHGTSITSADASLRAARIARRLS